MGFFNIFKLFLENKSWGLKIKRTGQMRFISNKEFDVDD